MPKGHEKRAEKRRHLIYYLHVYDQLNNELLGHVVDITAEGLMIIGEKVLPVDHDYTLHMTLPSEILGRESLDFEARSIWSRKDVDPTMFGTGFRLKDVDSEESRIIRRLIKDFGFQD
jgi:hypothetical protein